MKTAYVKLSDVTRIFGNGIIVGTLDPKIWLSISKLKTIDIDDE